MMRCFGCMVFTAKIEWLKDFLEHNRSPYLSMMLLEIHTLKLSRKNDQSILVKLCNQKSVFQ